MTVNLPEDVINSEAMDRYFVGLDPDEPIRRAALGVMRRCSTASSLIGTGQRLRDYVVFLRKRHLDFLAVTADDVYDYLGLRSHLSPETQKVYLSIVRVLYEEAIDRELIARNPTRSVRLGRSSPPAVRALSLDEAKAVIDPVRAELSDPELRLVAGRDYLLLSIMLTMGLRSKEVRRLAFGDFTWNGSRTIVHVYGKFRKHSDLPAPALVVEALAVYRHILVENGLEIDDADAISLPMSHRSRPLLEARPLAPRIPMSDNALYGIVRLRLEDANITGQKVGPHRLRKTMATLAWKAGADPVDIQRALGHSQLHTTLEHYIAPEQDMERTAGDLVPLEPMGSASAKDSGL